MFIHADFETRSTVDLIRAGAYIYAANKYTDVNCLGWAIDDDDPELWVPGMPIPKKLLKALLRGDVIKAWNAQFERLIWNNCLVRHGFPKVELQRFYCIAALSRARGFPGKLEKAARFAGIPYQKDMEGHRVMMKLCKPRYIEEDGTPVWWDDPGDHARQGEYCLQDVVVERAMDDSFIPFSEEELADYHLGEIINDRGVRVDVELARAAVIGSEKEKIDATAALISITEGRVQTHNQIDKILDWVEDEWKRLPDLKKTTVQDAMQEQDIPPHVYDVLELRLENAKAAVSKFSAMLDRNLDGVVYGLYMFRGAGPGRFSSTGVQIHNLVRDSSPDAIPILKKRGINGLRMLGDPVKLLSQMVRPAFIADPGRTFLIGDFAQLQARITAWAAGETKLLQQFRDNVDTYCAFGSIAYKRPITKADEMERFVSKGCILGLGFGGAEGALARTLKQNNTVLPLSELSYFKETYRSEFTRIVKYWYVLRDAALHAMFSKGTIIPAGVVDYLFDGEHLWCRLPSSRLLCYPFAKLAMDDYDNDCIEYRRGNRSPKAGVMDWPVERIWYGQQIENIAQAIELDLMMGAMRRLRDWFVRIHVHDEIVPEVPKELAEQLLPKFLELMAQGEDWSEGLPVKAEGKISDVYIK